MVSKIMTIFLSKKLSARNTKVEVRGMTTPYIINKIGIDIFYFYVFEQILKVIRKF